MAYVLGFIITDGNINGNALIIAQKDGAILERIASALKTDVPVVRRENNGGKTWIHTLLISRKEIVEDLRKLGVTEKKSLTVEFPQVPAQYLPHFIRGVIDGDGWVHARGYTANVTTGSQAFADGLYNALNDNGYNTRITRQDTPTSEVFRVWVTGKDDVQRFGRWLYAGCGELYLTRKRIRMESYGVCSVA